ncbi:MAG: VWA domain-containing protein [Kiritimatiellales bacterium]|nr:VWA domain-containing protein [Kiritimatiellales bacterium]
MKWNNPDILLWLLALLPLLLVTGLMIRRRETLLAKMAEKGLWETMLPGYSVKRRRMKNLLRVLALALALVALARPQWGFKWEEVRQRGLSIIVALDTSKSMLAQDIKPNRLQQAKWGVRDLVKELKGDRIGLVAFAGDAFLQCPATIDYAAFLMMLDDVYAGIIPVGGTDIYQALEEAIDGFDKETAADKVIILISDGEGTMGDPLALLPRLKEEKIRVFAIGVGTLQGELIQTSEGFVKDKNGNVVKSSLDEKTLERIALETGGFYVRSAPGDFGPERVYRQGIAELQREDRESRRAKIWQERFPWFLGASLLLLLMEAAIRPVKVSRERTQGSQKKTALGSLRSLAAILFLFVPLLTHAEDTPRSAMRKGLKFYKAGDYTNAVQALEKTALEFPDIGNYNLGNAHYRAGDFEAAEAAYNEALRTTDLGLQAKAYFNRGNALLARTTVLTGPEQIGLAAELAFQAGDMYEKAILLDPKDLAAKENFEKAQRLRLKLEFNKGKWLFDQAESLLQEFKAKDAQTDYQQAKAQFEHILADVDPTHGESKQYLPKIAERLEMLRKAVVDTEKDLATALQYIEDYQYMLAAKKLTTETDERKYAFDLKPDLKTQYEETIQKNQEVLKIIQELSSLNIAK